jgi:hypothetical protein
MTSISSVSSPPPLKAPDPAPPQASAPDVQAANDAGAAQVQAPLPPGQGTRVDQLV